MHTTFFRYHFFFKVIQIVDILLTLLYYIFLYIQFDLIPGFLESNQRVPGQVEDKKEENDSHLPGNEIEEKNNPKK